MVYLIMDYSGIKVLIMGLGLHGGGLESAKYLLKHGAALTVTDLRDERTLAPSIEQLENAAGPAGGTTGGRAVRYVLGRHEIDDFKQADMVVKNPGVRPDSPFLLAARRIETDISLFLNDVHTGPSIRLTAVTGSKGKSSVASALHWVLSHSKRSYLGGNITVSPLVFIDDLQDGDDVVLELSSFQLGDLRGRTSPSKKTALLKPNAAVLTPIMRDHLDRYDSMEAYINDKRVIYRGQDKGDLTIAQDDSWGRSFHAESAARPLVYSGAPLPQGIYGGWLDDQAGSAAVGYARIDDGETVGIVPAETLVAGRHQKQNLLIAGLTLLGLGVRPETIRDGLGSFSGLKHRIELFHRAAGITFYNDSAATIPEATAAAIEALDGGRHVILITGGTDKNLDFTPLVKAAGRVKTIILLAGSGSDTLCRMLAGEGIGYLGPFDSLDTAAAAALETAISGDQVLLSPGCASFGMFLNEFDRGDKWKDTIKRLV